ncbi:lipoprotein [Mycoplasma capricolum]|uniref:lipoprotein n=1 Tax=Mycoplasma capricolum TaxID=2095 RepID=UPI003DA21966
MKKLLTLLGSIGIVASTAAVAVACTDRGTNTSSKEDNNTNGESKPESESKPNSGETSEGEGMQGDEGKPSTTDSTKEKQLADAKLAVEAAQKKLMMLKKL